MNHQAATGHELSAFVQWATRLDWVSLPSTVQRRVRMVLLDDLGAILAGSSVPEVATLRSGYPQTGGDATALAPDFPRMSSHDAVEINGVAGSWLEVDEGYRFAMAHGGLYTIPVSLAVAERQDASVNDVGLAVVVGYELAARLARHFRFPTRTVHSHGTFSPVAAAAAASKLLGHDGAQFFSAITSACSLAIASPFDHAPGGALARNLWAGAGGRSGLLAAEAAACGVAGLPTAPTSVFAGLLQASPEPGNLTAGLGERLAIEDGYHKPFACCQYLHSSIEATLQLRAAHAGRNWPDEVAAIHVDTHAAALALPDRQPVTVLGAKFSLPHAVAAAVARGTGGPSGFDTSSLDDPEMQRLRGLMQCSELALNDESARPASVSITFSDGEVVTADCSSAKGEPGRPFGENDIGAKFGALTANILSAEGSAALAGRLLRVSEDFPVRDLIGQLKGGAL